MFRKKIAAVTVLVAAMLATPFALQAAVAVDGDYVAASDIIVSDTTPTPGGTVTVNFTDTAFLGFEDVSFVLTGENASAATLAVVQNSAPIVKQASASGAVAVNVTLPSNSSGSYKVTATGASGTVGVAAFTVVPADTGSNTGLPNTGSQIPSLAIWGGAGALALGIAILIVVSISRRRKSNA